MRVDELLAKDKLSPTTKATLSMIVDGLSFKEDVCVYTESEY